MESVKLKARDTMLRMASSTESANLTKVELAPGPKREWGFWSILSFSTLTIVAWEVVGTLIVGAIINGGSGIVIYGIIASIIILLCMYASLAEMASMYPIAGAQYIWTAHFAPAKFRVFASYVQGWLTLAAWQASIPTLAYLLARQVQGTVRLAYHSYAAPDWQTCVIMVAVESFSCILATVGKRSLKVLITIAVVLHVLLCIVVVIILLIFGDRASDKVVWDKSPSSLGWSNISIGVLVGLVSMTFPMIGADSGAHLAEETTDAPRNIPRAMVYSVLINGSLALSFAIVALYCITDLDRLINPPSGQPIIQIFLQGNLPVSAVIIISSFQMIIVFGSLLATMASAGRLTWAFARDGVFGNSDYFATIHPRLRIPVRAIVGNAVVSVLLSLIVIGSPIAFNSILSFLSITAFASNLLPIALFLHYRLHAKVAYGPWQLGKLGVPLNIVSLLTGTTWLIFFAFPSTMPVTWAAMNYSGPVTIFLLLVVTAHWFWWGKKHFRGPIVRIEIESHSGEQNGTYTVFSREGWVTGG